MGGVQVDDPRAVPGQLQNRHLMDGLGPAVPAPPPLPQELGSELFPRTFLHAALHHCKLPPGSEVRGQREPTEDLDRSGQQVVLYKTFKPAAPAAGSGSDPTGQEENIFMKRKCIKKILHLLK